MKETLRLLKRLYAKSLLMAALTLAAYFALPGSSANAQCTRPTYCGVGNCYSVNWLIDNTFNYNCSGGWSRSGGALLVSGGSELCGWSDNDYVKFIKPPFSERGELYQEFVHNPSYTNPNFSLSLIIEGGNSQDFGSSLGVWINNVTDGTWTFVDGFYNGNVINGCQRKDYSFYNPDWVGKRLRVYFDSYISSTSTSWRVDYVYLWQRTQ